MGITRFDQIEVGTTKVTGAASAATSRTQFTILTTESLTTAAATTVTYTFNNKIIKADSVVTASMCGGSYTTGIPYVVSTKVTGAGVCTITIRNIDPAAALNGTVILAVEIFNTREI